MRVKNLRKEDLNPSRRVRIISTLERQKLEDQGTCRVYGRGGLAVRLYTLFLCIAYNQYMVVSLLSILGFCRLINVIDCQGHSLLNLELLGIMTDIRMNQEHKSWKCYLPNITSLHPRRNFP